MRVEGPEDGRWLTMLHGFPTCSYDFAPLVEPLTAAGHRLLLFDFLGFGDSDKPREAYSYFDQVAITTALWDAHGIERSGVVAHDYGVSVAQELLRLARPGARPRRVHERRPLRDLHRPITVQKALRTPVLGALVARLFNERSFARSMRGIFSATSTSPRTPSCTSCGSASTRRGGGIDLAPADRLHRRAARERGRVGRRARAHGQAAAVRMGRRRPDLRRAHGRRGAAAVAPRADRARADIGHYPQLEDPEWVARNLVEFL